MNWTKDATDCLDNLLGKVKESIIQDAEAYSTFRDLKEVDYPGLEFGIYKTFTTLNEANKAVIIKRLGPTEGFKIIDDFQGRAMDDVSRSIMDEMMEHFDELPDDMKDILNSIKKLLGLGDNKKED